ncbi:MAG: hypothetical protein C5B55_04810 [Blastocatellia bacterium]|nr:MAG: hypothetical protein C5B55_04810 [Blastocatellia bacterium]
MNCKEATKSYERWLAKQTRIVEPDLRLKHERMSADIFSFMRATFYRWIELWTEHCSDLAEAPAVLGVGDLHVENFGTWRDQEGRVAWGINDFDEAFDLPYTNDLVRLAVSSHLAISTNRLVLRPADACEALFRGYARALQEGGGPFVLAERHEWLRSTVISKLRDPIKFWERLNSVPTIKTPIPNRAAKALSSALPEAKLRHRLIHRIAGLGSLGRQRFVALADWRGGQIAREAKALIPSAYIWLSRRNEDRSVYNRIVSQSIRCPDPFLNIYKDWIVRRLSPDCSRVRLDMLPKGHDEHRLLEAMGRETANVHLGSKRAIEKVKNDLSRRSADWLHVAAKVMVKALNDDWQSWREVAK